MRDAWHLRKVDDDLGPAGNVFWAFRKLATRALEIYTESMPLVVERFGLRWVVVASRPFCLYLMGGASFDPVEDLPAQRLIEKSVDPRRSFRRVSQDGMTWA